MTADIISKTPAELEPAVSQLKSEGYRLAVITCTPSESGYEITYSFDKDMTFVHLRITADDSAELPSVTPVYPGAFVYENEIHDLYGFRFANLSLDFNGTFIRTSVPYPFRKPQAEPKVTVVNAKKEGD